MYTDEDLNAAVEKGIFSGDSVQQFREHIASTHSSANVDEENFRLLSGFNDIFVVIASGLLLFSATWFASTIQPVLGSAVLAAISWALAEFFVRRRKMALPAIALLISFLAGIAMLPMAFSIALSTVPGGISVLASTLLTALFAWLHWRRFRVPITIAAGSLAVIGIMLGFGLSLYPVLKEWLLPLLFISGVSLFIIAMLWDASDTKRQTRNSDIAFWLHLAAAPLIVHPVFSFLNILSGKESLMGIALVLLLYTLLTIISLAVDRRAIMVSSLGYVLYAFYVLFETYGFVSYSFALAGICMGASLLLLSAFWHSGRAKALKLIPRDLQTYLPSA